jgi:6-pyruvoyltetrahydropterin/6-carboxytetrahydropterin synthase
MYEITVDREFCAAHALEIAGTRETLHGHNFRVTVIVAGDRLDADGLLCDFHTVNAVLKDVCRPLVNANLNETPPFDRVNPTAELIARHIGDSMTDRLGKALAPDARIAAVRVTETTGCAAVYRPRA